MSISRICDIRDSKRRSEHDDKRGHVDEPVRFEQLAPKGRTLFLFGEINASNTESLATRLCALDKEVGAVTVMISSPQGLAECGKALHELVSRARSPINLVGAGWLGSVATHVLLAAPFARRFCLPDTRFLIHQPMIVATSGETPREFRAREQNRLRLAQDIALACSQEIDTVLEDIEHDNWMTSSEAIDYRLISRVIEYA